MLSYSILGMSGHRTSPAALAAAFVLAAGSPAIAQNLPDPAQDEIVVTVTALGDRSVDALQGNVTLDRGDVIESLGDGLGETLEDQPGVASTFFGRGASRPIIRGLGEDRIRVLSNGLAQIDASSVSPDHAVGSEGLDAETIEVLRGAAALPYGGNAVGGVVNVLDGRILERAPDQAFSGQALASAATGLDEAQAALAMTFAGHRFALRVDGFTRDAGDYEIPGFAESVSLRAEETAEATAAGEPAPDFAEGTVPNSFAEADGAGVGLSTYGGWGYAGFSARRLESTYGIPEAAKPEEGPSNDVAVFAGPRIELEQTRLESRIGLNRGFGIVDRVQLEAAYVDYQHTEVEETGEAGTVFTNEGFDARAEVYHSIGVSTGVIGLTGTSVEFAAEGDEAFVTPTDIQDVGLFLVERFEFGAWTIDGGARAERRSYGNEAFGDKDYDLFAASLGAGYRPFEGLLVGLTVARSERAPTEIELFANGAHLATNTFEVGNPNLEKEVSTSIEGTVRWTGARFGFEVNAFRIGFEDYTTFFATGLDDAESGLPIFQAAQDDAIFAGGEITARGDLGQVGPVFLRADVSFDVVRAELDTGGNVPRIPPRSFTLGLEGETDRFSARAEWVNVAQADDLAGFETPTEGYDLINARFSFRPVAGQDRLVVRLDGRNLTNEEARVHPSFVKDLLPRPGRSVRLVLSSTF